MAPNQRGRDSSEAIHNRTAALIEAELRQAMQHAALALSVL